MFFHTSNWLKNVVQHMRTLDFNQRQGCFLSIHFYQMMLRLTYNLLETVICKPN